MKLYPGIVRRTRSARPRKISRGDQCAGRADDPDRAHEPFPPVSPRRERRAARRYAGTSSPRRPVSALATSGPMPFSVTDARWLRTQTSGLRNATARLRECLQRLGTVRDSWLSPVQQRTTVIRTGDCPIPAQDSLAKNPIPGHATHNLPRSDPYAYSRALTHSGRIGLDARAVYLFLAIRSLSVRPCPLYHPRLCRRYGTESSESGIPGQLA